MGTSWTEEQRQVIDLRDCNMLVSAAAGSGKTAVLVERIVSRIMDERKPVDIDRLLVVTFTNAAAAEMRERIGAALEKKLEENPQSVHLQRQATLIHHAQITTIHSFCLDVIRNHFDRIHLDPGFRIGDEGELKLLRQDVARDLLEEEYQEKSPGFVAFAESFAPGRSDGELEEVILQFYDFSMGYPWPQRWRRQCLEPYEAQGEQALEEAAWMEALLGKLRLSVEDMREQVCQALSLAGEADGPWMYEEALQSDLALLGRLEACRTYGDYAAILSPGVSWQALSRKRDASVSEGKKALVKEIRDQVKGEIKKLQEDYFYDTPRQLSRDMRESRGLIGELVRLAERFQEAYQAKKEEKNLVDFSDLEHYALEILVQEREGALEPTETALEYAQNFEEVMIDEYQDSNLVQEILLASVSRPQGHNRFIVGDVKQSIYRFRLARPELFMEKYRSYTRGAGNDRRIDLHKNFRSRRQVLEGVNLIFNQIMTEKLGGVEYDEDAALYPGAEFAPGAREEFLEPEVWLVAGDQENGAAESKQDEDETWDDEERQENDLRRREAIMAAERILGIVGRETVWDKEKGEYRPVRFGDVVVLLRTMAGWSETFGEVFRERRIPVHTGTGTGYFSALEVKTVLAYLRVLDNPRQDIPLAASMRSPMGGLTDRELAKLRIHSPGADFYTCCVNYLDWKEPEAPGDEAQEEPMKARGREPGDEVREEQNQAPETEQGIKTQEEPDQALREKLGRFWGQMEELRALLPYTPMHLLLWKILDVTGYGDYAAAMPGGAQRRANLDMLVEKAASYEATSYRGLFHFVRYIENLQKYEIDYGEASVSGESADAVRLMSIHKSKGLEFPIVLVCGMGKTFNQQDARGGLVLHPTLGAGCDRVDLDYRVKRPLLSKKVIGRQIREENLGEELRVLYVAMTRAKEKLILTGGVKNLENSVKKWTREQRRREEKLSYSCLAGASCYLDWVMPALLRHKSGREFLEQRELPLPADSPVWNAPGGFGLYLEGGGGVGRSAMEQLLTMEKKEELLRLPLDTVYDRDTDTYLERVLGGTYPFAGSGEIPGKVTVSFLKHLSQEEEFQAAPLYQEPVVVPLIPRFMKEKEETTGAARGTVYHRFLENMDFTGDFHGKFMDSQLETMVNCGKIHRDESAWISRQKMGGFLASRLAARMQAAARAGALWREQPFVLGVGADTIRPEWDPGEQVLIQGIIDAYFYEGEEIVLVDYKTDFVPKGQPERLAEKYRVQLDYYQMALERLTGGRVKERLIYSFCLDREIPV